MPRRKATQQPNSVAVTPQPTGVWIWVPIVNYPDVTAALAEITTGLDMIMAQVKVNQEDLDNLQTSLATIADDLEEELQALNVPAGDLSAVQAVVDRLRNDVTVPAATEPTA